jgi:hypothetical protein
MKIAYETAYRLARRLVRFIIDGIRFSKDYRDADAMLEEWAVIQKTHEAKPKKFCGFL